TGRSIQVVNEVNAFVRFAIAVGIFKDQQAVPSFTVRRALWIISPSRNPQPPLGVPGHLDRFDQFRKLFLTGEEIHFKAGGSLHFRDGGFAAEKFERLVLFGSGMIGLNVGNRRQIGIVHGILLAPSGGPDLFVAVGGQNVALRHFLLHHSKIGNVGTWWLAVGDKAPFVRLISKGGAAAINV